MALVFQSRPLIRNLSPPGQAIATHCQREYTVTTTPGQSTRSLIRGGNMSAVHRQYRSKPNSPEIDQLKLLIPR